MNYFNKLGFEELHLVTNYLRNDLSTLHSLLLVNRTFFNISIEFLYESVLYFNSQIENKRNKNGYKFENALFKILINSLDMDTKKILMNFQPTIFKNLFATYLDFCKYVSINETINLIRKINFSFPIEFLKEHITALIIKNAKLKKLIINDKLRSLKNVELLSFTLETVSLIISDISFSDDLLKIIHSQRNLYSLKLCVTKDIWDSIIPKLPICNTLKKLSVSGFIPDSFFFINNYPKLFKFKINDNCAFNTENFHYLEKLDIITLRNLKIGSIITINKMFQKKLKQFFEINGNRLVKLHLYYSKELMSVLTHCKNIEYFTIEITIKISKRSLAKLKSFLEELRNPKNLEIMCDNYTFTRLFKKLNGCNKNVKFIDVISNKEINPKFILQDCGGYEEHEL